jgi:two-component system sensor histidine kinase VanS
MLKIGITGKVFAYTLMFLVLVVSIAVIMFAQQFTVYYNELRVQNVKDVFDPLVARFEAGSVQEIIAAAEDFHSKNQSYDFFIQTTEGDTLYRTVTVGGGMKTRMAVPQEGIHDQDDKVNQDAASDQDGVSNQEAAPNQEADITMQEAGPNQEAHVTVFDREGRLRREGLMSQQEGYKTIVDLGTESSGPALYFIKDSGTISASGQVRSTSLLGSGNTVRSMMVSRKDGLVLMAAVEGDNDRGRAALYKKIIIAAAIMLVLSAVGAMLFARGITGPIKRLALVTRKMSALEDVEPVGKRYDEVGQLEQAVHNMYGELRENIAKLECEIKKVKAMESSQRYFFSMASHELKTPIAATSVLLEGMLAEVGDYKNRRKYLRECINLMKAQNIIVTELLEIVKLSDDSIKPIIESFGLLELIRSAMPEYTALAEQKDQRITVDVGSDIDCYSDKVMIRRALSNILMNAIQNSPEGEEIRIWTEGSELNILNTGVKIEDDKLERIFEPFFRNDQARSRTSARSGLGLTIVSKIFDQLNVSYKLANTSKGVQFTCSIPNTS